MGALARLGLNTVKSHKLNFSTASKKKKKGTFLMVLFTLGNCATDGNLGMLGAEHSKISQVEFLGGQPAAQKQICRARFVALNKKVANDLGQLRSKRKRQVESWYVRLG